MTDLIARRPATRVVWEQVGTLLLIVVAARYLLLFFHRGANLLDEGSQVAMANRILHGDVIYRDFLTVTTPGSFYTVAWLFQLFGTELMVVRWAVFALSLGIMIATLTIARQLMSWPFAAASALLTVVWGWFLLAPNLYSLEAMFFALVSLACYLQFMRGGESGAPPRTFQSAWLFAAGIACGLAILVKQNTGFYAAVALNASLGISALIESRSVRDGRQERRRQRRYFSAGIALVVIPALLYLLAIGAGPHLYENWIYYPLQLYPRGLTFEYPPLYPLSSRPGLQTIGQVLPAIFTGRIDEIGAYEIWQKLVLYLPWVVYPFAGVTSIVLVARRLWARLPVGSIEVHTLLAVTLFGLLTLVQAFPRADVTHILFGMQPAFILLGYVCFTCSKVAGSSRVPAIGFLIALLLLLPEATLLRAGYKLTEVGYQTEYIPLTTERARGVRANMRTAAEIDQVTAYLTAHTRPGDPIFVVPWAAGFYFLADRPNPTRFDVLLYSDPDVYPCLMARLDESRPAYVVYGYAWDVDGKRFSEYAQPVDDYIRTRYAIAERFDEYEIWRRLENAEPVFQENAGACRRRVLDGREYRRLMRQMLGR